MIWDTLIVKYARAIKFAHHLVAIRQFSLCRMVSQKNRFAPDKELGATYPSGLNRLPRLRRERS